MEKLNAFLQKSYTAFHAVENAKALLDEEGFTPLFEQSDWALEEGGKYYVTRDGAIIAFTVGSLSEFSYKIVASHTDSPAMKLKENPVQKSAFYATLNVETYGGGLWYSFLDKPLKIAGRVVKREGNRLTMENVLSPFTVSIPSVAIHQNREANDKLSLNPQIDLQALLGMASEVENSETLIEKIAGEGVLSYDLYLVNADMPYSFGVNDEFLASPRIDNLTSVFASLNTLTPNEERVGICVAACLDNEEIGNNTAQGAGGNFLESVLRRIAYSFRFDDSEYYQALNKSFLLSVDNAHAVHPNHPEKSDTTNKTVMGGGIVIKNHANKAYVTDALSSAMVKMVFDNADVKYQVFFNRSDVRSGGTLGTQIARDFGIPGVDIGLPQLAMHSSCECFKKSDYEEMEKGISAFYAAKFTRGENEVTID